MRSASTAGAIEFEWEPIGAICEASDIDMAVFFEDANKGAQGLVMEDLIEKLESRMSSAWE